MTQTKPNPLIRFMPSLADVAFLMPLAFLFMRMNGIGSLLSDGDTGWHLRTGEWILAHGRIPHEDLFSFSKPGEPWFAWEWLWDVAFGWLHQRWGLAAVALVSLAALCLTFSLLYRLIYRRTKNPLVAIGVTFLAAAGSTIHYLARPHIFTLLFTVVFLTVLNRVEEGRTRLLWWLPVLTMLWTNTHGGFITGILILCAYAGGNLLRAVTAANGEDRHLAARQSLQYGAALAGCLLASLVNPYFYHLHAHLFAYLKDPYLMDHIVEYQAINFHAGQADFWEAMLVLSVGAAFWFAYQRRFVEVLLLAGWGHLAILMGRNIPIFAIVAAPIVGSALVGWLRLLDSANVASWLPRIGKLVESVSEEMAPMEGLWRVHLISAGAMIILAVAMSSPSAGDKLKPEFDSKTFPARTLPLLGQASQRIFTYDQWGDYLIYRLWPHGTRVFVDGRSDFYGTQFGLEYLDLIQAKYNWSQTLARFGINTVVLRPSEPLTVALKESPRWRVIYDDGRAIVFEGRPSGDRVVGVDATGSSGGQLCDRKVAHSAVSVFGNNHVSQRKEE